MMTTTTKAVLPPLHYHTHQKLLLLQNVQTQSNFESVVAANHMWPPATPAGGRTTAGTWTWGSISAIEAWEAQGHWLATTIRRL